MARASSVDVVFFAAHADDVELTCGATLARIVASGQSAGIVELTRSEMGTRGSAATRNRESQAAARILGASFRQQLDFGDGGLRSGRDEELQIIEIIRRWRPALLFAPWLDDRHPDHLRAGRLVTDAAFYAGLRQLKARGQAHRPQTVIYYLQHYMPPATFIVDVSAFWKTKMRAIRAYKSQFFNPKSNEPKTILSHPDFLDMIEARGRHFGFMIGSTYGEAFVTKQPPKIEDVFSAYGGREI